jgi:tetratricopeptide (TPR) repeat protein
VRMKETVKIKSPEKRARIGERIKIAATSSGLTLKELAEKANTTPALIYQYVRGITNVPPDTLRGIAAATKVNIEFFDPDKDTRSAFALPAETDGEAELTPSRERVLADMRHLQQLADAHEEPRRNVSALLSTLHEMLSLARVSGDRKHEAYILWRLGVVRNETQEFEEARNLLIQARDIFEEQELPDYRVRVTFDLAQTAAETGAMETAIEYNREVVEHGDRDSRWRALVNMGGLYYRQHNYPEAMNAFVEAARALEAVDEQQRDSYGMPFLLSNVADVVQDTGHYEAALALWSRSLAQATEEKRAESFLEALLNIAQCCQLMGKVTEAKQRLEQAVVLASFMFDDQQRLGVARARLAEVMVALGSLEEAKDNARTALRIANRVGGARGMIVATLAFGETCLASGQYDDALAYADEAISESVRVRRQLESAQARNLRARVCLKLATENPNGEWLEQAETEARRALDIAEKIEANREVMAAHLTLARCRQLAGDEAGAEQEAHKAIEIGRTGAVGLSRLLGGKTSDLPPLLRSQPLNLEKLFAGRALQLPAIEWQAHYLQGSLQAKRLGPAAAFGAMRDAANALAKLLTGLSNEDALRFRDRNPEIAGVYEDLARYALTEADQQQAAALLETAGRIGIGGRQALPALTG